MNPINSQNIPLLDPAQQEYDAQYKRLFANQTTTPAFKSTTTAPVLPPPGAGTVVQGNGQPAPTPLFKGVNTLWDDTTKNKINDPTQRSIKALVPQNPQTDTGTTGTSIDYTMRPGETIDAYNARIASERGEGGITDQGQKTPEQLAVEAGMSLNDYLAINTLPTKEESDQIANELGITDTANALFMKPSQTTESLYKELFDKSGLGNIKLQMSTLLDEINKERALATEAIGAVNENPWLSEKTRVGRGKRLLDQLEARIGNKLNQFEQMKQLYDMGISEIDRVITRRTADFAQNQTINTAKLNYLQGLMDKRLEIEKGKKAKDLAGGFISAEAKKKKEDELKKKDTESKLITIDGTAFYWDNVTKKLVEVGKAKKDLTDYPASYQEWVLAGKPGKFADWAKSGNQSLSGEEIKQAIRKQMNTQEWKDATDEERKAFILDQGGDPADYGIF